MSACSKAGTAPAHAWSWRCDVCGLAILDGHGYLQFVDPTTGGYPQWSELDERAYHERYWADFDRQKSSDGWVRVSDLSLPKPPSRCRIQAYHRRCDPNPERSVYWVDVARLRGNEVLHWCEHLAEKKWFGRAELVAFIRRYQTGSCAKGRAQ